MRRKGGRGGEEIEGVILEGGGNRMRYHWRGRERGERERTGF